MKNLDKINSPKDLKTLERADLNVLAEEMRAVLLKKIKRARRTFRTELRLC